MTADQTASTGGMRTQGPLACGCVLGINWMGGKAFTIRLQYARKLRRIKLDAFRLVESCLRR